MSEKFLLAVIVVVLCMAGGVGAAEPVPPSSVVVATASSVNYQLEVIYSCNGNGLAGDLHTNDISTGAEPPAAGEGTMWLSNGVGGQWVRYQFDKVYTLSRMWVWNYNQITSTGGDRTGRGIRDCTIDYSTDGIAWDSLGGTFTFARADGSNTYAHNTEIDLGKVRAKHIRINVTSSHGDSVSGLSEVRFFTAGPVVQFQSASSEGLETVSPALIPVIINNPDPATSYAVNYSVAGGSASGAGVDYTLAAGTLSFPAGQSLANISIPINNDGLDENHETITLALSGASGGNISLGDQAGHTYTILDPRPRVSFQAASGMQAEVSGAVSIPVVLSRPASGTVNVDYSATGGSATGGGVDYTLAAGTLSFAAGQTLGTITLQVIPDAVQEPLETVEITLSNITGAKSVMGSPSVHVHTISDEPITFFKVDFAHPSCGNSVDCGKTPTPGTAKAGWWPWASPRWHDLYAHDIVFDWEPDGIAGTGVHSSVSTIYDGMTGLKVAGLRMCSLNSENCGNPDVTGSPLYDPICNTWLQQIDWPEYQWGTIVLTFHGLPAGEYWLYSYHNNFDCQRTSTGPECNVALAPQPVMPSIIAMPLRDAGDLFPGEGHYPWRGVGNRTNPELMLGCGDVEMIQGAYNVPIQQVTSDTQLIPSLIKFRTDGSAVLVIYENGCCIADTIRPSRVGGRAILNAFELKSVEPIVPRACMPVPCDGAEDVATSQTLSWRAAPAAVSHDVYLGDKLSAVASAGTGSDQYVGNFPAGSESYAPAGLAAAQTYYWRVDQVAGDGTVTNGLVWRFSTADCVVFDDFEADLLWQGLGGSAGYVAISAENPYANANSLEIEYYNAGGFKFSEAGRTFDQTQNWLGGPEHLGLYFRGKVGNVSDRMYVIVEDAAGAKAEVSHTPDLASETWLGWGIPLVDLSGINLAQVKKIFVGTGNRNGTASGATGFLYIDDVGLCRGVRCQAGQGPSQDLTGDCLVNFKDHAVKTQTWANTAAKRQDYRLLTEQWLEEILVWP